LKNKVNINLKEFYLKLRNSRSAQNKLSFIPTEFDQMINGIKQFSLLDLIGLIMLNMNAFSFNNFQLEIFFESMKQFHQDLKINFGFVHNFSFVMHGTYLYIMKNFHLNK
jgi:hypothetical protein